MNGFDELPEERPLADDTVSAHETTLARWSVLLVVLSVFCTPLYRSLGRWLITLEGPVLSWRFGDFFSPMVLVPLTVAALLLLWRVGLFRASDNNRRLWFAAFGLAVLGQVAIGFAWGLDRFQWVYLEAAKNRLEPFSLSRSYAFWKSDDLMQHAPASERMIVALGSSQMNFAVDPKRLDLQLPDAHVVVKALPGFGVNQYLQVADDVASGGATDVVVWLSEFDVFREDHLPVSRLRLTADVESTSTFADLLDAREALENRAELADLSFASATPHWRERDLLRDLLLRFWSRESSKSGAMPEGARGGCGSGDIERQRRNVSASIRRTDLVDFNLRTFRRFSEDLRERGIQLHVFEGQTNLEPRSAELRSYRKEVRRELRAMAREVGFSYVDEGSMPRFAPEDYCDVYHLGEPARYRFTDYLARYLARDQATSLARFEANDETGLPESDTATGSPLSDSR